MMNESSNEAARFRAKVAVVTGGAGGLGSAIVAAFAGVGAKVVIADRDFTGAVALADRIGVAAIPMELDVSSEPAWEALLDRVDTELGGPDVLVNNAGFFRPNVAFEDMPLELWRQHFAINSDGVFLGCKHGIRRMKRRGGGSIVNIGSGMSLRPQATASAYCGSKAAVLMTTRTAAAAAGRYGIRVNAVLPGAVPTTMLMGNLVPGQSEQGFLEEMARHGVLGRLATPEDIARTVLFLADPASGVITGTYIAVDGGNLG